MFLSMNLAIWVQRQWINFDILDFWLSFLMQVQLRNPDEKHVQR